MNSSVVINDDVVVVDLKHFLVSMAILSIMQFPCFSFLHVINSKVESKMNSVYFKVMIDFFSGLSRM